MPYIEPEVIEQARQIDLLTYLRKFEPDNVEEVKGTRNVYRTVDHDSLKMSNGKWFWWSQGFGGYNALDYLIKVRNYSFMDAVEILTGKELASWTPPPPPWPNTGSPTSRARSSTRCCSSTAATAT